MKMHNMSLKRIRKIVRIGDSSAVTIPKEYLRSQNLDRGDEVSVIFDDTGLILIKPISEPDILKEAKRLISRTAGKAEADKDDRKFDR